MPKITRAQGPSYSENDPRHVPAEDPEELQPTSAEDAEEIAERPRPDYGTWTKAQLNEELDRRGIEHNATATNAVLIEELERSDGGETLTGVND